MIESSEMLEEMAANRFFHERGGLTRQTAREWRTMSVSDREQWYAFVIEKMKAFAVAHGPSFEPDDPEPGGRAPVVEVFESRTAREA